VYGRVQLALLFSMQGVGKLLCAIVLLFCAYCIEDTNAQWRVAIIIGELVDGGNGNDSIIRFGGSRNDSIIRLGEVVMILSLGWGKS
jgi:hypothetical protein